MYLKKAVKLTIDFRHNSCSVLTENSSDDTLAFRNLLKITHSELRIICWDNSKY